MKLTKKQAIDPEAQQYIDWTISTLSDDKLYSNVIEAVVERLKHYFETTDREVLLEDLRAKMTAGAREHGELPKSFNEIDRELQHEYLDIIAYTQMIYFVSDMKLQRK